MKNLNQLQSPTPEAPSSPEEAFTAIANLVETAIDPDHEGLPDSFRDRIKRVHFGWVSDTEGGTLTVDLSDTTLGINLEYSEHGYGVFDKSYGRLDAHARFITTGKDLEFTAGGYDPDEVNNRNLTPENRQHSQNSSQVLARLMNALPRFSDSRYSPRIRLDLDR